MMKNDGNYFRNLDQTSRKPHYSTSKRESQKSIERSNGSLLNYRTRIEEKKENNERIENF